MKRIFFHITVIVLLICNSNLFIGECEARKCKSNLAILMYHNTVPNNYSASTYVIRTACLEQDFKYLKENGYNVLSAAIVIESIANNIPLPPKSVMLTFDDGYYFNMMYAVPLLQKYNFPALFAVVGEFCKLNKKNPSVSKQYTYLDFEDIAKLGKNKNIEIASHSYYFHHFGDRQGVKIKWNEDVGEYKQIFERDTKLLEAKLSEAGVKPCVYVYPFGAYCMESEQTIKKLGYKMSLTCNEGINSVNSSGDLFLLKRLNRSGVGASVESIFIKYGY